MERKILKYRELTAQEQAEVREQLLHRINDMEEDQARDAGKAPRPYDINSQLLDDMLPDMEAERWVDKKGRQHIELL